jgi:hypothetical protein
MIERIPDQSGDVSLRLRMPPYLHDLVMSYGREHGIGSTNERYRLCLVHLLRLNGRLPKISDVSGAICGIGNGIHLDPESERRLAGFMQQQGLDRHQALPIIIAAALEWIEGMGYEIPENYLSQEDVRRKRA